MIFLPGIRSLQFIILFYIIPINGYSQKQANYWFFGEMAGLNFNSGSPVVVSGALMAVGGGAAISDSIGNLMFYSNGEKIWDKTNQIMTNGDGLYGNDASAQAALIVPKPGSKTIFYLFTTDKSPEPLYPNPKGVHYNVIDMGSGNGVVLQKNIPLLAASDAVEQITAVYHANMQDVWVIVRKYNSDKFASFLVTKSGVNLTPVLSPVGKYLTLAYNIEGAMKVSPDGKNLFLPMPSGSSGGWDSIHRCKFDYNTGIVSPLYIFKSSINGVPLLNQPYGVEFSADSRFVYFTDLAHQDQHPLVQYDLIQPTEQSFLNSVEIIGTGINGALQIAPDGKIYGCRSEKPYLSVINNPENKGIACNLVPEAIYLNGMQCKFGLPQFIQSYFLRFDYTGTCAGSPFAFTPNFNPVPDSIHWNFGDPGSGIYDTTTQLSPTHVFAQGGSYTVNVFVRYPDGRTEQTSRIVTVAGLPAPNLGPDITVCQGTSVTLNPGSFANYTWSNGTLGQTITVADTGRYWVEVVNDTGCINRDTLQLQWFAQPSLDETNLTISPTTCNQSTGAITGLQVNALQPYTVTWKNGSGNILGTTPDLYHLPVDNYTLWVSDSAGCNTPVKTYTIHNVGDTLILSVDNSAAHCARPDGSIQINATSGLTEMLQYSLNGTDWFSNGGLFSQVAPGSYQVWVKDSLGCKKVYDGNPVVISNIPGPVVQPLTVVPETGGQSNGSISITATSAGDTVWYSINGGTPQPNNGLFGNLSAGSYSLTVADAFGCDTTFTVTLTNLPLIHLEAIAGDGSACLGNVAVVPLLANNFNAVQSFSATLYYDPAIVTCQNKLNTDPLLFDSLKVDLIPALGQVNISWNGNNPVSLTSGSTLTELSFASVLTGQSNVSWEPAPGICRFIDSLGSSIPATLLPGQVKVYSIPKANLNNPKPVCEGDDLLIKPTYQPGTGNGTITWSWTGPEGFTSDKQLVYFPVTKAEQSGTYTITLSDTNYCTSTITAEAIIIPTPKASFAGQDTLYLDPGSDLDAGDGFDTYAWNTGDSTQIIRTGAEGWYLVTLKDGKCSATDSTYITTPYAPLYLPNAFTPDGDRLNDILRPVTNPDQLTTYSMYIYNRWGGLIFESHNPSVGWDGHCSGGLCPAGAYIYVVKYGSKSATLNKKERVMRGMVTLVR